jgi:hypothetical protein
MDKDNHAESNAKASYENIVELVTALECDYDRLEELRGDRTDLADELLNAQEEYDNAKVSADRDGIDFVDDDLREAIENAKAQLARWDEDNAEELKELTEAATLDGELVDAETARERIQERPLSVQVRSGWTDPGGEMEAAEFEVLLTTGGPALRIIGELDEHNEPDRAWLEYQDWGTPWTRYFPTEQETLLSFCRCLYFGS